MLAAQQTGEVPELYEYILPRSGLQILCAARKTSLVVWRQQHKRRMRHCRSRDWSIEFISDRDEKLSTGTGQVQSALDAAFRKSTAAFAAHGCFRRLSGFCRINLGLSIPSLLPVFVPRTRSL